MSPTNPDATADTSSPQRRRTFSTGTSWEARVGYSRAVRVGAFVFVTGTIAANERGELIGANDAHVQTVYILEKIRAALDELGASLNDVVRTRMYVTNIDHWEAIGDAHAEYFRDIRPCTTMVEVIRLVLPGALVEIEADAVIDSDG